MKLSFSAALAGSLAIYLGGCNSQAMDPVDGGTSDDTHTGIALTGRVFDGQTRPMGAVIARLRHRGFADTTDGDGRYVLKGDLDPQGGRIAASLDTVDLLRNGSVVHSLPVSTWKDTLPDVFLLQRDVSGTVLSERIPVASASAIVWDLHGDSVQVPLEWSAASGRYSGFAWSPVTGGLDTFYVRVRAHDDQGRVRGVSGMLRFTSLAGDIYVPPIQMGNADVRVRLSGSVELSRGQIGRIFAIITDSLRLPVRVSWKISDGDWREGRADTSVAVPFGQIASWIPVQVRVSRSDGSTASDSFAMHVPGLEPQASLRVEDASFSPLEQIKIHMEDTSVAGTRIVERRIGVPWNIRVSGADTILTAPASYSPVEMVYEVLDDQGRSGLDTIRLWPRHYLRSGLETRAGSGWVEFEWGRSWSEAQWGDSWWDRDGDVRFYMTDGTIGQQGVRFTVGRLHDLLGSVSVDSFRYSVFRQTASKSVTVKVGRATGDSSFGLELPSLVWDFEENRNPPDPSWYFDEYEYPIWCGEYPKNFCSTPPRFVEDPVFGSRAVDIRYHRADDPEVNPRVGDSSQVFGLVSGWKDVRSLSMRARGTPTTAWVWLEAQYGGIACSPSYGELRAKGITLGWPVQIDSMGSAWNLSVDDLRWSDGLERLSPSKQEILDAAVGFKMLIHGGPGVLILDDIRFENR